MLKTNLARNRQLQASGAVTQQQLEATISQVDSLKSELNQATAAESAAQEKIASGTSRLQAAREALKGAEAAERQARLELEAESDGMNPEVRQTLAQLELQRWELDQTIVRAPFRWLRHLRGPASRSNGDAHRRLTAPIVFVTKEAPTFIASFPQNVIPMIEPGLEAELAFKAYPGRIFNAKVSRIVPIIPEGQFVASGQLQSVTPGQAPGRIPVVFEVDEEVAALNLPAGSQATVAVYTHHVHAMAIVRKIVLRMKSWENYVFFLSNMNVGH